MLVESGGALKVDNGAGGLVEIRNGVNAVTERQIIQLRQIDRVKRAIFGDAVDEEGVTDLFADPPNYGEPSGRCSIKKKLHGERILIGYAAAADVELLASLAAGYVNREINRKKPRLAINLPTGERIQAHVPPASLGPKITLRVPMKGIITLPQFAEGGVMSEAQVDIMRAIVEYEGCLAISGMMGSGKTTLQRALNEEPRIKYGRPVYVMDTVEYLPTARDGVVLTTSDESEPPIDVSDLIRDGLREDATHLIPTEVRGQDAKDVIHGWTTGHSGNCTMHTGSVKLACDRIAQMVGQGGVRMDTLQMRWIAQAIHFVVQIKARRVDGRMHRRVTDIVKVMGYDEQTGFQVEPVRGTEDVIAFMQERMGSLEEN